MVQAHVRGLSRHVRFDPRGVGVGLALPASGPAEMRGQPAVPLQPDGSRRIGEGYGVCAIVFDRRVSDTTQDQRRWLSFDSTR